MIRVLRYLLLLTVLCLLALPAGAQAGPVLDCRDDGILQKRYSNEQLRKALDNIPSDLDEYTNCREIIQAAISSGSDKRNDGGNGSGGGGGGNAGGGADGGGSITAEEQQARVNDAAELDAITGNTDGARPELDVGGERVEPGSNGLFDLASASNDVPGPLLVALIAIGLLALVGGLVALRERVPALARIPLVSKIPRVSLPRFRR